jgi:uncharacterized protein HemX
MDTAPESQAAVIDTHVPVLDPNPAVEIRTTSSTGSVIAILLIVLLLVMGAFYVWGQRLSEARAVPVTPVVGE